MNKNMLEQVKKISPQKRRNLTLISVMNLWLETKRNLKVQSFQKYENIINTHVKKIFQEKALCKLTLQDFELFIQDLEDKKVSISVQKTIFYIIKATLNFAQKNHYYNNYIEINNIQFKGKTRIVYTLSINEQRKLELELKHNVNIRKCCILLCLYTGLRVGEVCGLKWENINFEAKTIQIKRTIQRIKNPDSSSQNKTLLIESSPKSDTSNRVIPIPDFLLQLLAKYRNDDNLFLLSNSNNLYDPRLLESFYERTLNRLGIRHNKFHTLRHTFATRAVESKMDIKTLSEILGHSSVDITLKLYVHSSMELKRKSIESIVDYMTSA